MPNLGWIHCNLCYYHYEQRQRKIYHLSCYHLLCRNCMAKTECGKKCPICKRPIDSHTEVGRGMDPRLKELYEPSAPVSLLDRAYRVINFQQKQQQHLIDRIVFCRTQLQKLDEVDQALKVKALESQRRYEKLRNYRRALQESLRRMQTTDEASDSSVRMFSQGSGLTPSTSVHTSAPFVARRTPTNKPNPLD